MRHGNEEWEVSLKNRIREDGETDHAVLVDTGRNVVVYQDFDVADAPEDMYLYRRLRTFVNELNRLAEEGGE